MVTYVIYIMLIGVYNFLVRLEAIKSKQVPLSYFKLFEGGSTEKVTRVGRHYNHQFELPMLYLIGCCAHLAIRQANDLTIFFAWSFIVARVIHTYVHLGTNNVRNRALIFFVGWFFVLALFLQLGLFVLKNS